MAVKDSERVVPTKCKVRLCLLNLMVGCKRQNRSEPEYSNLNLSQQNARTILKLRTALITWSVHKRRNLAW